MQRLSLLLISLLLPVHTWATEAGNPIRGKTVAVVRCGPCHHLNTPSVKVGPSLKGIYGRAPSISGTPFRIWNDDTLEAWLSNPRAVKANTRMLLPALPQHDRRDIIAWLRSDATTLNHQKETH